MKKMGNSFSQWIERQVPPGLDWWTEVKWAVSGLAVGALWSLVAFFYQFSNACRRRSMSRSSCWYMVAAR